MLLRRLLPSILAAAALCVAAPAFAQSGDIESYKFDFGAGVGMSGYLGDANESNLFKHPGVVGNLSFRYLASNRFAIRGLFSVLTLSGDTADWDNVLPGGENYKFTSTVFDLGARAEFNFFPYGIGETYKRLRRWTPYLSLGVGVCLSNSGGNIAVAPTLPMGFGIKYKFAPRWNLMAEFSMTKVFGDHVDGSQLADLYQIKSSMLKNTDWFSALAISISYEFGPRCVVCHRVD